MRRARAVAGAVLLALITLTIGTPAARAELKPISPFAATESAPPSAFGARPIASPLQSRGPLGSLFAWVVDKQQTMQRTLAMSVKDLKSANPVAGALTLAGLSFLYGILHAVGPGHGKTVISSYIVANEETARRGVILSFIAAGVQAMTAVVLVSVLLFGLNASGLQINAWSNQLESVSYALIALVGLYLLATQLLKLWRSWRGAPLALASVEHSRHSHAALERHDHSHHVHDHEHGHSHAHDHSHDHAHADDHDHHHLAHDHQGHHHAPGEACNHIVDARQLAGPMSWRKMMAVVLSVGIRPCTGAILVLVFAVTQGLFWAGVAATFAMAFGTAITVAVLATFALGSRELALKLGRADGAWANAVWTTCALGGAIVIFLFGALLFAASLGPARPF
jgi:nickel/cobalt transporter (NicO) family protein